MCVVFVSFVNWFFRSSGSGKFYAVFHRLQKFSEGGTTAVCQEGWRAICSLTCKPLRCSGILPLLFGLQPYSCFRFYISTGRFLLLPAVSKFHNGFFLQREQTWSPQWVKPIWALSGASILETSLFKLIYWATSCVFREQFVVQCLWFSCRCWKPERSNNRGRMSFQWAEPGDVRPPGGTAAEWSGRAAYFLQGHRAVWSDCNLNIYWQIHQ